MFATVVAALLLASGPPPPPPPPARPFLVQEFGEATGITLHDPHGLRAARGVSFERDKTQPAPWNDDVERALIDGLHGVAAVAHDAELVVRYVELSAHEVLWLTKGRTKAGRLGGEATLYLAPPAKPLRPLAGIPSFVTPEVDGGSYRADLPLGHFVPFNDINLPSPLPAANATGAAVVEPEPAESDERAAQPPASVHWRATLFRMDCQSPLFDEKPTPASEGRCERRVFVRVKVASLGGVAADRDAALRDFAASVRSALLGEGKAEDAGVENAARQ